MRPLSALLCLILLVWVTPATAQDQIHRCIGSNGNPLFTDQPCAALQATPLTAVTKPGSAGPAITLPPLLCAASLGQLRQSVIDAFAHHDANRLAGLMLWNGYGRGAAVADIRSLGVLMRQPLLDLGAGDDPDADGSAPMPATSGSSAEPFASTTPPAPSPASDQLV
ncbi:MAG TPA: DUF4124 domain-containing protein, partial [Rhodanobacter sp.]